MFYFNRGRLFYGSEIKSGLQGPGETLYMPHFVEHAVYNVDTRLNILVLVNQFIGLKFYFQSLILNECSNYTFFLATDFRGKLWENCCYLLYSEIVVYKPFINLFNKEIMGKVTVIYRKIVGQSFSYLFCMEIVV